MTHLVIMKLHQWQNPNPELAARILFMENSTLPDNSGLTKQFALDNSNFTLLERVLYFIDPQTKMLQLVPNQCS